MNPEERKLVAALLSSLSGPGNIGIPEIDEAWRNLRENLNLHGRLTPTAVTTVLFQRDQANAAALRNNFRDVRFHIQAILKLLDSSDLTTRKDIDAIRAWGSHALAALQTAENES